MENCSRLSVTSSAAVSSTSLTLLANLRDNPNDQESWRMFVDRYGAMIGRWCRSWGLQDADAQDVTQDVLLKIAKRMRRFDYKPGGRFRSWLRTVAHHAWCDFLESKRRSAATSGAVAEVLDSVEARDNLLQSIEEEYDRNLLQDAMAIVQPRVEEKTWQAFTRTAIDGRTGAEAAAELGMKVGTVYVAKSRVQKMLQEQIEIFEDE